MQATRLFFTGARQVEITKTPVQEPGPHEVVVRGTKSLISTGTESICYLRKFDAGTHWDNWVRYPFAPGYSLAGIVTQIGDHVTKYAVGDRVTVRAPHHQYVTVPEDALFPIPDDVEDEQAAWFALSIIAQIGVRAAEHHLGDSVAIVGLGLLGQLVIQYMRLMGARHVIAVDPSQLRTELAAQSGATVAFPRTVQEAFAGVQGLVHGEGVDVVYDITGAAPVFAQALPLVRRFGKLVLLGDTGSPTSQHLTMDVIRKGIHVVGAHMIHPPDQSTDHAYWSYSQIVDLFFTYLQRGDMRVEHLITHRFSPLEAASVYETLQTERENIMGCVFDWETL